MARAAGGDVRVVYSPLDALEVARAQPGQDVVFFAVGFETTAPANAMAVRAGASARASTNFALLVSHVLVPPAMRGDPRLAGQPRAGVPGAPGTSARSWAGRSTSRSPRDFGVPIVVTGFEPLDLLEGILMLVRQLEEGRAEVENQYVRAVRPRGERRPRMRGRGRGLRAVRPRVARHRRDPDERPPAARGLPRITTPRCRFPQRRGGVRRASPRCASPARSCRAGRSRTTARRSARECTPEHPLGAPMVSSEGACAAYFLAGRRRGGAVVSDARSATVRRVRAASARCRSRPASRCCSGTAAAASSPRELIRTAVRARVRRRRRARAPRRRRGRGAAEGVRLAFTTDSFVVQPAFFPGATSARWP